PAVSSRQIHRIMNEESDIGAIFVSQRFGKNEDLSHVDELKAKYPEVPVIVCAEHTTVEAAVTSMKKHAQDYIQKPFAPGDLKKVLSELEEKSKNRPKNTLERSTSHPTGPGNPGFGDLIFHSKNAKTQRAFDIAFRAAETDASVLLLGPSGTGKSVLAREIHRRSPRQEQPFVTVSCPSLSEHLLESELFGHVRGAFTGAVNESWGKVHVADTGTLFMDEIGDMPLKIQPRLLRLLQEMRYERLGETKERTADIRVISATNCPIADKIADGNFREDLLYRLNVISVHMPPLKERMEDLPDLIDYYLKFYSGHHERGEMTFSEEARETLLHYPWPGNLREMSNVIERTVILAESSPIGIESLPPELSIVSPVRPGPGHPISLDTLTELHIQKVLDQSDSLEAAADTLGIDTATLYRKRKKMGLID
ncbi:MAG: sigma-54 dependent transcriptional regulator, partial [Kiritimatiellia bacterium]